MKTVSIKRIEFEEGYAVDETGRGWSRWRRDQGPAVLTSRYRPLKGHTNATAVRQLKLRGDRMVPLARTVLEAFGHPQPSKNHWVKFVDGNPLNCALKHVRWTRGCRRVFNSGFGFYGTGW